MRQWSIDAFAEAAFKGNPACVLEPFDAWPPSAFMQALAKENNQSETAYLLRTKDPARFGLRWFTPGLEVKLCGHATLAAGIVILDELGLGGGRVTFDTLSGPLHVARRGCDYVMDFPSDPPKETATPEGLEDALGAACSQFYAAAYSVAILEDEATVRGLSPDIAAIERVTGASSGGPGNVIVAAKADEGSRFDVVDRFFAPGFGIAEDPATGSAHCILAPLFGRLLGLERVRFHQAFPGRGADITTELKGDRVRLIGRGCVVAESRLRLHPTG